MRNKSAFNPPQVHNSFRKTQRQYPQSRLIQYQEPHEQRKFGKVSEKFCFSIVGPATVFDFHPQTNQNVHNDCVWFYTLGNSQMKFGKRKIIFKKCTYFISNWEGDQFPMTINICIDNFQGYCDFQGKKTNRCVVMRMKNVATVSNDYNSKVYDVSYEQQYDTQWQLPQQMTSLKIFLTTDQNKTKVKLPLPNPMLLQFEIIYE